MDTLAKIVKLLKEKGKSQKDLTDFLCIHKNNFTEWNAKRSTSYLKYISQIAEYLEVSTDYLLGNESNIKVYDEHDNIVVLDDETREIIDSLRTNPEMKILFSVTKKATKEDIIQAVKIIEALKGE